MALHKYKGHLTSGLLFQFWLLLTFFSIPQLRSEVVTMGQGEVISEDYDQFRFISYMTYFTLISIMVILNCFADKPPIYTTYPKSQHPRPCPELTVSFLDKIHFFWFTKVCFLGWRRPLVETDLYDIPPQDTCAEVHPPFEREFLKSLEKNKK
jgi:ATP-binding cassette, subfamily C (CFTR/MRP), member 1